MKDDMKEKSLVIDKRIGTMRNDFNNARPLEEGTILRDPFALFGQWFSEALKADPLYANAMTLSTLGSDGSPDARIMLLRNVSYGGFTFFTNYGSKKAFDMRHNAKASLLFFWKDVPRQVRIQGSIKYLPSDESDRYFASRPFESQVGAHVSRQSQVIANRSLLDDAYVQELEKYNGDKKVPRPELWGGYVLIPRQFEFWQGGAHRLHDRMRFRKAGESWMLERLMP